MGPVPMRGIAVRCNQIPISRLGDSNDGPRTYCFDPCRNYVRVSKPAHVTAHVMPLRLADEVLGHIAASEKKEPQTLNPKPQTLNPKKP